MHCLPFTQNATIKNVVKPYAEQSHARNSSFLSFWFRRIILLSLIVKTIVMLSGAALLSLAKSIYYSPKGDTQELYWQAVILFIIQRAKACNIILYLLFCLPQYACKFCICYSFAIGWFSENDAEDYPLQLMVVFANYSYMYSFELHNIQQLAHQNKIVAN